MRFTLDVLFSKSNRYPIDSLVCVVCLDIHTSKMEKDFVVPTKPIFYKLYVQKQPLEVFCKKRSSKKFLKINRKTPVLESLF